MPACVSDPLLRDYAATAADAVDEILDQIAAGPGAQRRRDPVPSLSEAAGVLLDMRAWRVPAGAAVRVVYSDERQIEGLFRGDAWCAAPAAAPAVAR